METHEPIIFHKKRDFTGLFNVVFEFLRQEFKPLFKRMAIVLLPIMLLQSLLWTLLVTKSSYVISPPFVYALLIILLYAIFMLFIISSVYSYIEEYVYDDYEGTGAWGRTLNVFKRILPVSLLLLLFIFLIYLAYSFFVFIFMAIDLTLGKIMSILAMITALYFSIQYAFFHIVKVAEKIPVMDVFTRCNSLIEGHRFRIFGKMILFVIIQAVFMYVLYLPMRYSWEISNFLGIHFYEARLYLLLAFQFIFTLSFFFMAISLVYFAFEYFNLLERKEAPSLNNMVDELKADEISANNANDSGRDTTDNEIKYGPTPEM